MDLEIREALALSDDRKLALAQLLPGSEDCDYYRCLYAQHANALDEADAILRVWAERHGHTERYDRLRLRQLLCRVTADPPRATDEVRDHFGAQHSHEAEVEDVDPTRPTRLPEGTFDGNVLLQQAVDYDANLSQVTDEGLHELIVRPLDLLDPARRRVLLSRLHHTAQPEIVKLVAEELATRGSTGFGTLAIHDQLTLDQLIAVAQQRPELRGHLGWVTAVVRRMRPHASVDLETDREARAAYLEQLWRFVAELPPAINTLKAHVLWHVLDTMRARGVAVDPALVRTYLALPRTAGYLARKWIERHKSEEIAQLGQDLRHVSGLPPAPNDEELVRDLLQRRLDLAEQYAEFLDRAWLDAEIATAQLLLGDPDADRATLVLGPARAAALRDRIELAWCAHNATRFGVAEPIVLEAEVKNVGELVVKVFRIDPLAYFQHQRREVNTDLDLDGLAASHELVMKLVEPAVRRVRRTIDLTAFTTRAGTYVVDLIGNGMSSRVLVHKGRLRHLVRIGAAGHVVTIIDEAGRPRPDARAWIGDREYAPDERGTFAVPFSTSPSRTPMLLACGDIASVQQLDLVRESYQLAMNLVLDRETLAAGRTARAIARVSLTVAGAPASLSLLKRPTWDVTLTDRQGVTTTKSQPLVLADDGAAVLEWPMGENAAHVGIVVRGAVEVRSEQREHELSDSRTVELATIHASTSIEALYLARTSAGWVISALGKTGEPRARRPVTVALFHRWARTQLTIELGTDANGRTELGALPGIEWIMVTLGGLTQRWLAGDVGIGCTLHAPVGRDVVIPVPPGRTAGDLVRRMSIVELRAGVPARHPVIETELLDGGVVIRGLTPGDYELRASGVHVAIVIAAPGPELAGTVVTPGELVETPRQLPVVASIEHRPDRPDRDDQGDRLRIVLRGASTRTRVQVVATQFASALVEPVRLGPARALVRRFDRTRGALYVSGRELGDEYRYVLERRSQKRYPSLLLDKPSLLLNPWSRRTTTTDVAEARGGGAFRGAPAPAPAAGYDRESQAQAQNANDAAFPSFDFLPEPVASRVLANLEPDADGVVVVPREVLGTATTVTVIVDDPVGTTVRRAYLPEVTLAPRDLRLRLALQPDRHATQRKAIAPLVEGGRLVIEDLATARVHLVDSVDRAHGYLLALRDDATLREFAFVTRWHMLGEAERRELYSKYACHELHLFLYFKDRAFFAAVVRPYLAHKRTKTFVDHWLLGAELARYLEPAALSRLNAVERALLAQRLPVDDRLARVLGDQVAILPPDPTTDTRLIDALLGAATLDADDRLAAMTLDASSEAEESAALPTMAFGAPMGAMSNGPVAAAPARRTPPMPKKARPMALGRAAARDKADDADESGDDLQRDLGRREQAAPHYRSADKTQEWAENNWWHLTPAQSAPALIPPNRLWRDLAQHRDGSFLSPALGLATSSFAEAMCALAVTDLPFVAAPHAMVTEGPQLTIVAAGNALAGSSQIVDGELTPGGLPLVIGMSYVRADDRYEWDSGEQRDKYVEAFATGVVYTCQVVLANPTSSRQRIAALVQIPRGSVGVAGARVTHTIDVALDAYGTHGHEYSFYFPAPGSWSHFPVHVTRAGQIVAAAPGRTLEVTSGGGAVDPRSWSYVSQRGTLAEVVSYLDTANLAAIDTRRVAWRLRDRAAYDAILGALERRREYCATLWAYALLHGDRARIRVWLRAIGDRLLAAGPVLEMLDTDAEELGSYEHLELAPLINARAHRLGPKLRILNDGLAAQYTRFLELVSHRRIPSAEDLLAAAAYLVTQDRVDDALATLARVKLEAIADRMQHDYLAAYLACIVGDVGRARELAVRWREHPVDRWRHKFSALSGMLDEITGIAPAISDPRSRDQQHAELAAKQPAFEIAVDRDGIVIRSQHITALELRFFEMDVELLFSRQPFVQSDVSRFSFIEPGHREQLGELPPEHRIPWPGALRGKNVVVEAVGAGQRKAKVHYANDLTANLANQVGQLRVQRASDRSALVSTYVKVYARKHGGAVQFYKDGYTDLRGWFDYASLSTTDLDQVERFAILVCSDQAGAAILEASPPVR